jgi:hypothetical protein
MLLRGFLLGEVSVFMIRPVMLLAIIATIVGVVAASGELRQRANNDTERVSFSNTCSYYRARADSAGATSGQRDGAGGFVTFLSDACVAAEASMDTGTRMQRARAVLLLSRIALLRQTVNRMNTDRATRAAVQVSGTGFTSLSRITPSGEFLIAHRMGVLVAFNAWLESGADFSLASYP